MSASSRTSRFLPSARALLRISLAPSLAAWILAACTTVGPDHEEPTIELPPAWHEASLPAASEESGPWWQRFGDPILDGLVERALDQGLDLREALARVEEARALRGVAGAQRLPSLDASLAYVRRGESDNSPFGAFVPDTSLYSMGLDAAWEVDLWGRVRRSVEAADADYAATVEDARAVAVTVAAETAFSYVDLRAFRSRLAIARRNVELQEQTLELVRGRFDAGLVGERDLAQALTILESTRARLPALEIGARSAENRLAVLTGVAPGTGTDEWSEERAIPVPPLAIAVGVPADLLRRRPDVRRAERDLAAQVARIGVAEAERYPQLTLSGNLGLESDDLSDLFESDSGVFGIGPSLRWNLFDGGARRGRVEAQDARAEGARVRWERAVLVALEETENALTRFAREQSRRASLGEAAVQARNAIELAQTQYVEGLTDFQAVLDSQRTLADLEDELAQSEASIATSAVALFKALGGGWEARPDVVAASAR